MFNFQFHRSLKLNSLTLIVCLLRPDCTLSQLFIFLSMLVKSRPASDPVDSDLHQQSPAGETDGLVHRGFCFHTMNIDRFHLPCLLIDMLKMCCVFGFWFTGNLKKCRGKHIMRVSPVDDVPRHTTCLDWTCPGSPM